MVHGSFLQYRVTGTSSNDRFPDFPKQGPGFKVYGLKGLEGLGFQGVGVRKSCRGLGV